MENEQKPKVGRDFILILEGGGCKGLAHMGGYTYLNELRITKKISSVAGSSAGANAAMCIALGMTIEEMNNAVNLKEIASKNGPGFTEKLDLYKITYSQSLVNINKPEEVTLWIDLWGYKNDVDGMNENSRKLKTFTERLAGFLIFELLAVLDVTLKEEKLVEEEQKPYRTLTTTISYLHNVYRDAKFRLIKDEKNLYEYINYMVNFSDLRELLKFSRLYPKKFIEEGRIPKDLTVTITDCKNVAKNAKFVSTHFEDKEFDKLSIGEVVAASQAFPRIWAPIKLNETNFADGGILSNLPIEILTMQNIVAGYIPIIFRLDKSSQEKNEKHILNSKEARQLCSTSVEWIAKIKDWDEPIKNELIINQLLHIFLNPKPYKTINWSETLEDRQNLFNSGYQEVKKHFEEMKLNSKINNTEIYHSCFKTK